MSRQIAVQTALESLRAALEPLQCAIDQIGGGRELRLRVYDDAGRTVARASDIQVRRLCDRFSGHESVVGQIRESLEDRGFRLAGWHPPA